jgi:hypothetical protein
MMPITYRESKVSAYHNYLVNNMLTPGFVIGDPGSETGFYFLARSVAPGESLPGISARLVDETGGLLLELDCNQILTNPAGCSHEPIPGGYCIQQPSGQPLLEVRTHEFTNGYLTRLNARLFDERGNLRIEPLGESIQVHGEAQLALEGPL